MITRTDRLDSYHIVRETKKRTKLDDDAIIKHADEHGDEVGYVPDVNDVDNDSDNTEPEKKIAVEY